MTGCESDKVSLKMEALLNVFGTGESSSMSSSSLAWVWSASPSGADTEEVEATDNLRGEGNHRNGRTGGGEEQQFIATCVRGAYGAGIRGCVVPFKGVNGSVKDVLVGGEAVEIGAVRLVVGGTLVVEKRVVRVEGKPTRAESHPPTSTSSRSRIRRAAKHTRANIPVAPARLHLRDVLLAQPELLVQPEHILPDQQRGHAVRVVRHAAERLCALARGE